MKNLCLFIDESGSANPKVTQSEVYILAGCSVRDQTRNDIKVEADQIKFKYWGRTDIVFHSKEMGRREGDFKKFQDVKLWHEFQKDLFNFLYRNQFQLFFVLVDKNKAKLQNWAESKVYKDTADLMVKNFVLSLLAQGDIKGRLVVESATSEKDFYFHKAARYYLSRGIPELGVKFVAVQDALTEISFVTKENFDIEEQIADLLAYPAKLKFLKKQPSNNYEKEMLKILDCKTFRMNPKTGVKKKKYYSEIKSYEIIP